VDVDECDAFPCEHGFCTNLPGDYKCHCFPGFEVGQPIFNKRGGRWNRRKIRLEESNAKYRDLKKN
jgi:hypothetical protein